MLRNPILFISDISQNEPVYYEKHSCGFRLKTYSSIRYLLKKENLLVKEAASKEKKAETDKA